MQQRISGDIPEDLKIFFPQVNYDEETWLSAEIQRRTGSHDAALQALQDYLVFYPSGAHRAEAMMAIGEIAGQSNQDDLARSYFAALISFFPDDTLSQQARLKLADLAFEEDDYKSAAALYSAIEPHLSGQLLKAATAQKIVCHYRLGQVSKANQLADDFKKRYSDRQYEAIFLYEEGSQYLEEKNFAQAEKTFKNVANKYKDYAEAAQGDLGLGRLYMILNKTDDALKLLTSIPEKYKDPKIVAVAYINLADFYYKNRQIENAIIACKKVFDLQDNGDEHEQALRIIINAYDDVRLWDRAIAYAREYVEQYPNTSYTISYRIKIGLLLTNLKEYDRAIYHFQNLKPLADADTEPEIQFWIAKAYSERGNTEDAITEFLKVKYLSKPTKLPWGDTALYEAGQAYRKMGKLQRAKELFQRVVQSRGTLDQIGRVAGEKVNEIDSELRSN
ncbi:hypothetical protein A2V82_12020 [candidate division KSB1 bacterium RBG_16_48_16]|nr:MAG: hypothetical protein A2V82_12020 [candidate division KSB1 bacterium RBG_16_48_16]